jgi:hypothetical protein
MFKHILLCTHGTGGAQKAEKFVFEKMAGAPDLKVTLLTVLDEDWRGMTGDDWLNSSKTQATFLDHVEGQVSAEIKEEWERIHQSYPEASKVKFIQKTDMIAEAVAAVAKDLECDGIVIGAYQKTKGLFCRTDRKGLKDTLENKKLHPILPCPLIIIP